SADWTTSLYSGDLGPRTAVRGLRWGESLTEQPMSQGYERELAAGIEAVALATRVCQSVQSQITQDVLEKKDKSRVTVADYASQAVVCRALAAVFPNAPIVGEEDAAALREPDQQPFRDRVKAELAKVGISADESAICGWIDRGGHDAAGGRYWTL